MHRALIETLSTICERLWKNQFTFKFRYLHVYKPVINADKIGTILCNIQSGNLLAKGDIMTDQEILSVLAKTIDITSEDLTFDGTGYLTGLNLTRRNLKQLPPEIGLLTNLQELYLFKNQLEQIPPEIGKLTNLQVLHLENNLLEQLPPQIGKLTRLRLLSLSANRLNRLPPQIGELTSLQKLYLGNNQLRQ